MLSRFFGKGDKSGDAQKDAQDTRGLEVVEDDPDTAWSMWDNALAEQDSRFSADAQASPPAQPASPDAYAITQPMALDAMNVEQRKNQALDVVELHHRRIASTIRTLWGYKECSVYINKLIMAGGDGMGQSRVGFNQDAVAAMLALADLHDAEFGPPDVGPDLGFTS